MSYSYVDDYLRSLPQTLSSTLSSGGGGCSGRVSDADLDEIIAGLLRPPGGVIASTRSGSNHTIPPPAAATPPHPTTTSPPTTSATSKYDSDTYYSSLLDVDAFISALEGGGHGGDAPPNKKGSMGTTSPHRTVSMATDRGGLSSSRTPASAASGNHRDATSSLFAGARSSGSPHVVMHSEDGSSAGGNTDLRMPPPEEESPNPSRSVRFQLDSTPEPASRHCTSHAVPEPSTPHYDAAMGATCRGLWTSSPTPTVHAVNGTTPSQANPRQHYDTSSGPISPQPYAEEISRDEEVYHSSRAKRAAARQPPVGATPSPQHRRGGLRVSPSVSSRTEVRSSLFFGEDDEVDNNNGAHDTALQMDWNTMFTPERYDYLQRRRWGLTGSGDGASIERVDLGASGSATLDEDVSELVNVLDAALSRSLARQESVVEKETSQMAALTRFTSSALRNITARVDPTLCQLLDSNDMEPEGLLDDGGDDVSDVSDTTTSSSDAEGVIALESESQIDDPQTPLQPGRGGLFPQNDCSTPLQPNESMPGWWELTELITRRLLEAPSSLESTLDPSSAKAVIESARVAFQGVLHTLVRKEEFLVAATPQVGRTSSATPRRGCAPSFASPWAGGRRSAGDGDITPPNPIPTTPRGDKSLVRLCKNERVTEVQQALSAIAASLAAGESAGIGGGVELGYGEGSEGPRLAFLRQQQATLEKQLDAQRQAARDTLHRNAGAAKAQYDAMRSFIATNDAQLADLVTQKEALEGRIEIALHSRRSHMVQFVEDLKSRRGEDAIHQNKNSNSHSEPNDSNIAALKRQHRLAVKETEREAAHAALMATLEREVRVPLSTIHPTTTTDTAPTPDYAAYYRPETDPMDDETFGCVPDVDWDAVVPSDEGEDDHMDGDSHNHGDVASCPSFRTASPHASLHHQPTAIFNHVDPMDEPPHRTTTSVSMGALFADDDDTDDNDGDCPLEGRF